MPRGIRYKPTRKHLSRAYKLYKKGTLYKDIVEDLGISNATWTRHREKFEDYFRRQEEKDYIKDSQKRGKGRPKGQRKLTLGKRNQILTCLENDMTIEQSARMVGVCRDTIYNWCKEYPEFKRQIDTAKDRGIDDIKKMLKKSAKGGYITEVITTDLVDHDGKVINTQRTKKRKYIKSSVQAQQFILVNRAGWSHDSEGKGSDRKGEILEALENITDISDDDMKEFE